MWWHQTKPSSNEATSLPISHRTLSFLIVFSPRTSTKICAEPEGDTVPTTQYRLLLVLEVIKSTGSTVHVTKLFEISCSLGIKRNSVSTRVSRYTPVRKVLAHRKVLWISPGDHRCTKTSSLILDPTITTHEQSFRPPEV